MNKQAKSFKSAKHDLLDDIDDLQEMSKKWMKHNNGNQDKKQDNSNFQKDSQYIDESSSQLVETETEDELQYQPKQQYQQEQIQLNFQKQQQQQDHFQQQQLLLQQQQLLDDEDEEDEDRDQSSNIQEYNLKNQNFQENQGQQSIAYNQENLDEHDLSQSYVSQQSQAPKYQSQQKIKNQTQAGQKTLTQSNPKNNCSSISNSTIGQKQKQQQQKLTSQTKIMGKKNTKNNDKYTGRNHNPQIIDEDTEHFKVKLDHLINVFKTDAISEFMGMKKSMLEDQKQQVKYDTEKYLSMYEEKAEELSNAKQGLAEQMRENQMLVQRYEGFADLCGKAKDRFRTQKALGNYFQAFKNYKKQQLIKKQKKKFADYVYQKNLLKRMFGTWQGKWSENKQAQKESETESKQMEEVNEITAKYNKELQTIRDRLVESEKLLQEANLEKQNLQDNLKKAFMRGVCALNFEAMNILDSKGQPQQQQSVDQMGTQNSTMLLQNTQNINNTLNTMDQQFSQNNTQQQNLGSRYSSNQKMQQQQQQQQQHTQEFAQHGQYDNFNDDNDSQFSKNGQQQQYEDLQSQQNEYEDLNSNINSSPQKTMVFYQQPKIESKDHKWRDAPVVGVKKEIQDVNISSNYSNKENGVVQSSLPDFVGNQQSQKLQSNLPSNLPMNTNLSSKVYSSQNKMKNNLSDSEAEEIEQGRVIRVTQQAQEKQVKFEGNATSKQKTNIKKPSSVQKPPSSSANNTRSFGKTLTTNNRK